MSSVSDVERLVYYLMDHANTVAGLGIRWSTMSKRRRIAIHEEVMKKLKNFKDTIHFHASKGKMPMSWNEFFLIICLDWEGGRMKCHCGHMNDCQHCQLLDRVHQHQIDAKIRSGEPFEEKDHN